MAKKIDPFPDADRQLLRRHYSFYRSLDRGKRKPVTEAQRHFVAVCRGQLSAMTSHELAYTSLKKYCALTGISADEAQSRGFTFPTSLPEARAKAFVAKPSPEYSGEHCPRCARKGMRSPLVWRHARDPSVPGEFLGCSRYPECRYIDK